MSFASPSVYRSRDVVCRSLSSVPSSLYLVQKCIYTKQRLLLSSIHFSVNSLDTYTHRYIRTHTHTYAHTRSYTISNKYMPCAFVAPRYLNHNNISQNEIRRTNTLGAMHLQLFRVTCLNTLLIAKIFNGTSISRFSRNTEHQSIWRCIYLFFSFFFVTWFFTRILLSRLY